jgi:hypothetical protein
VRGGEGRGIQTKQKTESIPKYFIFWLPSSSSSYNLLKTLDVNIYKKKQKIRNGVALVRVVCFCFKLSLHTHSLYFLPYATLLIFCKKKHIKNKNNN